MATRNDEELMDLNKFQKGVVVDCRWEILKMLDEGGFGRVFLVSDQRMNGRMAAMKMESGKMDGGSVLKWEVTILKDIHVEGTVKHIPELLDCGKTGTVNFLVMEQLGENFKKLKDKYFPEGYPLRTRCRVAIQCFFALKIVHDSGFIHRDIKAGNFMLGHSIDAKKARIVHILDFGLSRRWAYRDALVKGGWKVRVARSKCDFRGTFAYSAPSMHDLVEQDGKEMENMKLYIPDEVLLIRMPVELMPIMKHLRLLDYYSRPDYYMIYGCLETIRLRSGASFYDRYEWESQEQYATNRAEMLRRPPGYVNPAGFFASDPTGLHSCPSMQPPIAIQQTKHSRGMQSRYLEEESIGDTAYRSRSTYCMDRKAAPLPKDDKGPLRSLVASNLAKVALDESKDALIEFYAPWCGHCKAFEPKYKQLAAALAKSEQNLVLAKFDATANDAPHLYVYYFLIKFSDS